jgi:hypothetical protein
MNTVKLLSKSEAADFLSVSIKAFDAVAKPMLTTYRVPSSKDHYSENEIMEKRGLFEEQYTHWRLEQVNSK